MKIRHAVITAGGKGHRRIPLQTASDVEGQSRTALWLLLEEARAAGIESVRIVVQPGDEAFYLEAAGELSDGLTFVAQDQPRGYGDAVLRAGRSLGFEPFLLMVSDHLFVSLDPARNCARQLVETAEEYGAAVSAVQSTHESRLGAFGTVTGPLYGRAAGLYEVKRVREKPTPTLAEQELMAPGLRPGHYLCFFGMHVITPAVIGILAEQSEEAGEEGLGLSPALDALASRERYLALEIAGRRYDLESRHGLLIAQLALALHGKRREEILASLLELMIQR
ncbi:MAG TPA: sugar phosphate nucleotidyltransferase [Verrucomicrobiales bacterium]|nr:sugar phosphate nucleotidyltransferase [Verrucomicrobiales bacterium]